MHMGANHIVSIVSHSCMLIGAIPVCMHRCNHKS